VVLALVGAGCSAAPPRTAPTTTAPTPTTTTPPAAQTTAPPAAPTTAGPCRGTPAPIQYAHVVWIVMENRSLGQVAQSGSAPYLAGLARQCGQATDYSGVAHPSLPNYIAMTSGSTHGITDDSGPAAHPIAGPSIFSLLGPGWRSLQESMPSNCDHASGGEYATKHNPAVYFTGLAAECQAQDVAMVDAAPDVRARFTLITPNLCDDGHDCSTATADHWLSVEVPLILASPEYQSGTTAAFITWDENDAGGTVVPTYVVAPSVPPGIRVAAPFSHYSLLRSSEEMLGVGPLLGAAARAPSMRGAFHI
jgi:phosphatidylinositol-3-phosphatase